MNLRVESIRSSDDKRMITWESGGMILEKEFQNPFDHFIELSDKSGFAVLGSFEEFGKNNAFLVNADGSIRFYLEIPEDIYLPMKIHDIYYDKSELTVIVLARYGVFAFEFNEHTGEILRVHDTR